MARSTLCCFEMTTGLIPSLILQTPVLCCLPYCVARGHHHPPNIGLILLCARPTCVCVCVCVCAFARARARVTETGAVASSQGSIHGLPSSADMCALPTKWFFFFFFPMFSLPLKIWDASRICVSSLCRGHANLLCIVPILVYVLPKRAPSGSFFYIIFLFGCSGS